MRDIVALNAVFCVELCVLANVFGVRGRLWSGWWSNYIWSADRGGEIAADGGGIETAGESAIHADIGRF